MNLRERLVLILDSIDRGEPEAADASLRSLLRGPYGFSDIELDGDDRGVANVTRKRTIKSELCFIRNDLWNSGIQTDAVKRLNSIILEMFG